METSKEEFANAKCVASISTHAEAAAALYGAQMWEPSDDTGLVCVVSGYGGGLQQPGPE